MLAGDFHKEGSTLQATQILQPARAEASYQPGDDQAFALEVAQMRLLSLEELHELILRYEQSFAALKKKSTKQLKKGDIGSIDALGADLSAVLQSTCLSFLPYRKDETLRLVEAAIRAQKQKILKRKVAQKATVQKLGRPARVSITPSRSSREGITAYSNWAEQLAALTAEVPPGQTRFVNRETVTRSPDGSTVEARHATIGKWKVLKQTVTETDATTVKVVEAKFSHYSRDDGKIKESYEKETTIRFKESPASGNNAATLKTTTILHNRMPRSIEPRLDQWAWQDFLRQFVRVNPDTMRFTVGKREYQIDQYRFREMARRGPIVQCLGMRGQIGEPYLSEIAAKLAYLHRVKTDANFESIIEDSLPLLIGNIDYFNDYEEAETRPSKTRANDQRPWATVLAHTTS